MTIRSFCNADVPQLVRLWNEHWSSFGPDPSVSVPQFEQAILARPWFSPHSMFVADGDQPELRAVDRARRELQGWCQVCRDPRDSSSASVTAVCLASASAPSVALDLVAAAERWAAHQGVRQLNVGVVRDATFGLAGMSPIGHGIGIAQLDSGVSGALQRQNFRPCQHAIRFSVAVSGYRAPVNRDSMQLRRTTDIRAVPHRMDQRRRPAAALSHLDVESHQLIDRHGNQLTQIPFWFSDPEAEVMNPVVVIADLTALETGRLTTAESYLLSTVIASLAIRGIAVVETVVDDDQVELRQQLEALGMTPGDRGARWEKSEISLADRG